MSHDMHNNLSSFPKSYWLTQNVSHFPALTEDIETEVAVVGGGIVGILTAYLAAKAGKSVVLIEGKELLRGATGHTTAKISAQHGLIYDDIMKRLPVYIMKRIWKAAV